MPIEGAIGLGLLGGGIVLGVLLAWVGYRLQ